MKNHFRHKGPGATAEQTACRYLEQQGLKRVVENYLFAKVGEIDLIMLDRQTLVFVEVRSRKHSRFGLPEETISKSKQTRLIKTANHFLQNNPKHTQRACRFDVLALMGSQSEPEIHWIPDAFAGY